MPAAHRYGPARPRGQLLPAAVSQIEQHARRSSGCRRAGGCRRGTKGARMAPSSPSPAPGNGPRTRRRPLSRSQTRMTFSAAGPATGRRGEVASVRREGDGHDDRLLREALELASRPARERHHEHATTGAARRPPVRLSDRRRCRGVLHRGPHEDSFAVGAVGRHRPRAERAVPGGGQERGPIRRERDVVHPLLVLLQGPRVGLPERPQRGGRPPWPAIVPPDRRRIRSGQGNRCEAARVRPRAAPEDPRAARGIHRRLRRRRAIGLRGCSRGSSSPCRRERAGAPRTRPAVGQSRISPDLSLAASCRPSGWNATAMTSAGCVPTSRGAEAQSSSERTIDVAPDGVGEPSAGRVDGLDGQGHHRADEPTSALRPRGSSPARSVPSLPPS